MLKVLGSSVATKYQIRTYLAGKGITDAEELMSLYMRHGAKFNIEYELAIGMMLIYTNFLQDEIVDNNICGIGLQFGGDHLEKFASQEDCIIAQYEILRCGADYYYNIEGEPHSVTVQKLLEHTKADGYVEILKGNIDTITKVYDYWNYKKLTAYKLEDLWRISRDITIIREVKKYYETGRTRHFFVVVATATRKESLYNMKRDLSKLGFKDLAISVDAGFYRLEVGRVDSEREANVIKTNLSIFGYTGTIKYRDVREENENATQGTHE